MPSQIRQNYHQDCEAAVNRMINMEMYASYTYQSMVRKAKVISYNVLAASAFFDLELLSHRQGPAPTLGQKCSVMSAPLELLNVYPINVVLDDSTCGFMKSQPNYYLALK